MGSSCVSFGGVVYCGIGIGRGLVCFSFCFVLRFVGKREFFVV